MSIDEYSTYLPNEHMHKLLKAIKPSMRWNETDDINAWRKTAQEKLCRLLGLDKIKPYTCEPRLTVDFDRINKNSTRENRFRFLSEEGVIVPCHLLIPKDLKKPLPTVICLQGHSNGMHISLGKPIYKGDKKTIKSGDRDFALRAVSEGCCALTIEQRCFGESSDIVGKTGCSMPSMRAILLGRTIIGERVWDIMRAVDILEKHFTQFIDTDKIICLGNSGGGTATVYAAALEARIKIAVPSCSVCTFADSIGAVGHCACNYVPDIAQYFDMADLCSMIAPRGLIVVSGKADEIFPISGAVETVSLSKSVYDALGASDKCFHIIGNGGHRFYADDTWPIINRLIDEL